MANIMLMFFSRVSILSSIRPIDELPLDAKEVKALAAQLGVLDEVASRAHHGELRPELQIPARLRVRQLSWDHKLLRHAAMTVHLLEYPQARYELLEPKISLEG